MPLDKSHTLLYLGILLRLLRDNALKYFFKLIIELFSGATSWVSLRFYEEFYSHTLGFPIRPQFPESALE